MENGETLIFPTMVYIVPLLISVLVSEDQSYGEALFVSYFCLDSSESLPRQMKIMPYNAIYPLLVYEYIILLCFWVSVGPLFSPLFLGTKYFGMDA